VRDLYFHERMEALFGASGVHVERYMEPEYEYSVGVDPASGTGRDPCVA